MTRPYGDFARAYFDAGWQPMPLPPRKKANPPDGFTGHYGRDVTIEDVDAWLDERPNGNIGLRMPDGVLGIDVDDYPKDGKVKVGGKSLAELIERNGPLPPTWISTSREGVSGIRFFRVPPGQQWPGTPGPDIEGIQPTHRYAVVWPSYNPDSGQVYRWLGPDGEESAPPRVADLPELPESWVNDLCRGPLQEVAKTEQTDAQVMDWLGRFQEGPACARTLAARDDADFEDTGSRHDLLNKVVFEMVRLGQEGHRGVRDALKEVQERFYSAGISRDVAAEFGRSLKGAVEKTVPLGLEPPCSCLAKDEEPAAKRQSALQWLRSIVMRRDALRNMPAPEPLINGLLQRDSLAWIYGAPSSAKTFMSLDWSCTLASGLRQWQGYDIPSPGPVLYVAGEGVRGVALRVNAWEQANGRTAEDLYVIPEPVQVSKDEYLAALTTVSQDIGAVLIVLDTQARMSVGVDENGATEMGQFIEQIERLRRETGACVLTVHHARKDGATERGSGAIRGAATTMIQMSGKKQEYRRLEVDKQKDVREIEDDLTFELVDVEGTDSAVLVRRTFSTDTPDGASGLHMGDLTDI